MYDVLHACHNEPSRGHYVAKRTTYKLLQSWYYWSTMFNNANQYVSRCDDSQRIGDPNKRDGMPLTPEVTWESFEKWGLDFLGPIDPPSNQKSCILVYIDYHTKWVDNKALAHANEEVMSKFIILDIFKRYGIPRELVTHQGS